MKQVGMFAAKTNLSSLVDEVEKKGREVIITRHGKPVARLAPLEERLSPQAIKRRRRAFEKIKEIRDRLNLNLTHEQIKARIEEGRR
jgi:prevent-host-death family protein